MASSVAAAFAQAGLVILAAGLSACGGGSESRGPTAAEAAAELRQAFPGALAESEAVGSAIRPGLTDEDGQLAIRRSLVHGQVERDSSGAFWLATAAGRLVVRPTDRPARTRGARLVAHDDAALFANVAEGLDVVVRPRPSGAELLLHMRQPAQLRSFSWRVELPGGERLIELPEGGVGVIAPSDQLSRSANGSDVRQGDGASPAQKNIPALSGKLGGAYSPAIPAGYRLVATVSAPLTVDRHDRTVPSAVNIDGDSVRLVVKRDASSSVPLATRLEWIPAGNLGDGWFAYSVDRPLKNSSYVLQRGQRLKKLGCGFADRGTIREGVEEASRQIALRRNSCLTLVERGEAG